MSLITTTDPQQAEGGVARIYNEVQEMFGYVPNGLQLDSVDPERMALHWNGILATLNHPTLSQTFFTCLRYLIAEAGRCEYCIGINAGMLINMHGIPLEVVNGMLEDPTLAPLDEKEKALLLFALRMVKDSNSSSSEDIAALKGVGCSEREIYDTVSNASQMVAGDMVLNVFKVQPDNG
jgi:alkylhydroperoxidase family enzyme